MAMSDLTKEECQSSDRDSGSLRYVVLTIVYSTMLFSIMLVGLFLELNNDQMYDILRCSLIPTAIYVIVFLIAKNPPNLAYFAVAFAFLFYFVAWASFERITENVETVAYELNTPSYKDVVNSLARQGVSGRCRVDSIVELGAEKQGKKIECRFYSNKSKKTIFFSGYGSGSGNAGQIANVFSESAGRLSTQVKFCFGDGCRNSLFFNAPTFIVKDGVLLSSRDNDSYKLILSTLRSYSEMFDRDIRHS